MDRQTVLTLQHLLTQTGNEVGSRTLPSVAAQAAQIPVIATQVEVLDLHASLLQDAVLTNSASDAALVSLRVDRKLNAGATVSGRILGVTSNGAFPAALNLWLTVDGAKVMTHTFTTPDVVGNNKGFAADFTLTVRGPGSAVAGGVLHLAYNAPTVLPAVVASPFSVPADGATFTLGMNWSTAIAGNVATAKIAFLSVDKL